ncbi:MAG: AzlC family ABC transporter permease [Chloroflexi bacterium]|nr:AzlC family ABC transporter permease [Chloroflexota bacterium]
MPPSSRSSEFAAGVRAQLPLLLGVTPFGLAYGAYAVDAGLSTGLAQAMSVVVFGGASQFVGARQMAGDVPGIVIVLTTLLVNSRHMLYSASMAPFVEHLDRRWRWLLAYLLTDEAYATAVVRYRQAGQAANAHWFFFGTALALWVDWQIATAFGVFLGKAVPEEWSLGFALPLTFIAIVIPVLRDRPAVAAAAVAGVIATIGFRWDYGTNVLVPALAGLAAAMLVATLGPVRVPDDAPEAT